MVGGQDMDRKSDVFRANFIDGSRRAVIPLATAIYPYNKVGLVICKSCGSFSSTSEISSSEKKTDEKEESVRRKKQMAR